MNKKFRISFLTIALLAGAVSFVATPAALAADAATTVKQKQDYENRLSSVKALTDALKRDADKPGIKDTLTKVDASRKEAEGLAAAGEYDIARSILDEGYRTLTATLAKLKSATGQGVSAQSGMSGMADPGYAAKRERDLVERDINSTKALIDALKRQNAEKNAGKGTEIAKIEADTQQAQTLLAAGKVGEADKLIDAAYGRAKAAIAGMQKASGMKTGSAAMETSGQREMGGMSGELKRSELDSRLKSIAALRDALKRRNPNAAEIGRSEQMSSEAGRLAASDPDKALAIADEAYEMVKAAIKSSGS